MPVALPPETILYASFYLIVGSDAVVEHEQGTAAADRGVREAAVLGQRAAVMGDGGEGGAVARPPLGAVDAGGIKLGAGMDGLGGAGTDAGGDGERSGGELFVRVV